MKTLQTGLVFTIIITNIYGFSYTYMQANSCQVKLPTKSNKVLRATYNINNQKTNIELRMSDNAFKKVYQEQRTGNYIESKQQNIKVSKRGPYILITTNSSYSLTPKNYKQSEVGLFYDRSGNLINMVFKEKDFFKRIYGKGYKASATKEYRCSGLEII